MSAVAVKFLQRIHTLSKLSLYVEKEARGFNDAQWLAVFRTFNRLGKSSSRADVLRLEKKIAARFKPHFSNASAETIGAVAQAYGRLGLKKPEVLDSCYKVFKQNPAKFSVHDLTHLIWSSSILGNKNIQIQINTAKAIEKVIASSDCLVPDDALRLHRVSLAGRVKWGDDLLGKKTRKVVDVQLKKISEIQTNSSYFQKEVTRVVSDIACDHWEMKTEYFFEGYFLDIAFPKQKIDVEADGPSHFYQETREPVIRDKFKDAILTGLGWRVIHVDYRDWEQNQPACIERLSHELIDKK